MKIRVKAIARRAAKTTSTGMQASGFRNLLRLKLKPIRALPRWSLRYRDPQTRQPAYAEIALFAQIKQSKQKQPERIHEVPIVGSHFGGDRTRHISAIEVPQGYI